MRFGWTFVIGIIPGVGDVADASLNYLLVVRKARQAEIPSWLLRHMLMNNAVSAAVGFVPIAGDVVLAMYKANSRNAALLEEFLRIRGEEFLKLKAQGKNPEAVAQPSSTKPGDSSKKVKEVAKGVTKADAEQVKPGAGREQGEVVNSSVIPGGLTPVTGDAAGEVVASGSGISRKSGRKSFSAWLGSNKTSPGEHQGKFVEDVGSNLNKANSKQKA